MVSMEYRRPGCSVVEEMPGAGGGGYLALVVEDAKVFAKEHEEAIELHIRRV